MVNDMATSKNRNVKKVVKGDRARLDVYQVMSLLPVSPYHEVADVGCSGGDLSIPLGKCVYRGNVTALDTTKKDLTEARRKLKENRLTNVRVRHVEDISKLKLKDNSLDGALAAFLFQESDSPEEVLKDVARCLKNGGWLAIIEANVENVEGQTDGGGQNVSLQDCRRSAESVGFTFYMRHNLSNTAYMVLFTR